MNYLQEQLVVLVHGFNKNASDMFPLKRNLENIGYTTITVNLPTRFGSLQDCANLLARRLESKKLKAYHKIHLVGHSMGGLIIRSYLANYELPKLGRCVLIATPNQGSKLVDMANKYLPFSKKIFKPFNALSTVDLQIQPPVNSPQPEIGVIAGNVNNLALGIFLSKESDGRVEVESTKFDGMHDFIITKYGHNEIHKNEEVAKLVGTFLDKGTFVLKESI